jgi:hypothetical protein
MGQSLCIAINWHRWAEWGSLSLGLEISQLITVMCEAATHPHGGMELGGRVQTCDWCALTSTSRSIWSSSTDPLSATSSTDIQPSTRIPSLASKSMAGLQQQYTSVDTCGRVIEDELRAWANDDGIGIMLPIVAALLGAGVPAARAGARALAS